MSQEHFSPKIDIHITTCHHSSYTPTVRNRHQLHPNHNITEWNRHDRLEISKISVDSIMRFVSSIPKENISRFCLIDDGSDMPEAIEWMNKLDNIEVIRYDHGGTANALNEYHKSIDADIVAHFEDDQIMFNPLGINWLELFHKFLSNDLIKAQNIIALSTRGRHISEKEHIKIIYPHTDFFPLYQIPESEDLSSYIVYNYLSNVNHFMLKENYDKFFPLLGNRGSCEDYMNTQILQPQKMFSCEIQEFIYSFHSHSLNIPIYGDGPVTSEELDQCHIGIEYGIKDMHEYFLNKKVIECSLWSNYNEDRKDTMVFTDYRY